MADQTRTGPAFLDELREDYRHAGQRSPLDLDVPWSHGRLVVRYGVPAREKTTPVLMALAGGETLTADAEDDLLISACIEVLGRDGDDLVPLDPDSPVRFDDDRLAAILGFPEPKTARDCLHSAFRVDEFPLSITSHVGSLLDYMQRAEDEAQARVEGKPQRRSGGT